MSVHRGGRGVGHVCRTSGAPGSGPPPVNTILPVVSGSLNVGSTLTCSTGTWSNSPTSYSYQWYEGGNPVGSNANTYVSTTIGASIYCTVAALNPAGFGFASSASVGPITGAGINAPTLALHTASGVTPASWDVTVDSTVSPGMYIRFQIASDIGFVTITSDTETQIEGSDWEAGSVTIGNALNPVAQPSGQYWARARIETTPGDPTNNVTSGWSNTITDTIVTATTTWATSSTDKSQYLTLSNGNLTEAMNNTVGANCGVRGTTTPPSSSKRYFETTTVGHGAGSSTIAIGITDSATALGPAVFPTPGNGSPGVNWRTKAGTTSTNLCANGAQVTGSNLTTALADGDLLGVLSDDTANTVTLYHKPGSGAWYTVQTVTMTSQIPASRRPYIAGFSTGDQNTTNFGQSAFSRTLGTGELMWG